MTMSEKELDELEGALRAATPAPWQSGQFFEAPASKRCFVIRGEHGEAALFANIWEDAEEEGRANARVVAALRNAAPSLISEVRALRARVADLEESMRNISEAMSWRHALDDAELARSK